MDDIDGLQLFLHRLRRDLPNTKLEVDTSGVVEEQLSYHRLENLVDRWVIDVKLDLYEGHAARYALLWEAFASWVLQHANLSLVDLEFVLPLYVGLAANRDALAAAHRLGVGTVHPLRVLPVIGSTEAMPVGFGAAPPTMDPGEALKMAYRLGFTKAALPAYVEI